MADRNSLFWQIVDGKRPAPACAMTLGIEFGLIDPDRGTIEVHFAAKTEFLNPAGNVQGGFLVAMLYTTVSLNVQFHRPAKAGALKGIGRVVLRGKEVCQLSGELLQDHKIIATATATAVIRKV